jgi:hypothetical protein
MDVIGNNVCKVSVLGLVPYIFDWIEFRGICGKPVDMEPLRALVLKCPDSRPMSSQAVTNEDDRATQSLMNASQESDKILGTSIVVEQFVVEPHARRPWCATEGRQGGDSVVSTPRILLGCASPRGPYSPSQRLEQIATFVEKNDASLPCEALFLTAANLRDSSGQWQLHPAHVPEQGASGDSNPAHGATATPSRGDNEPQTAAESSLEPVGLSSLMGHIPNTLYHSTRRLPIGLVAVRTA